MKKFKFPKNSDRTKSRYLNTVSFDLRAAFNLLQGVLKWWPGNNFCKTSLSTHSPDIYNSWCEILRSLKKYMYPKTMIELSQDTWIQSDWVTEQHSNWLSRCWNHDQPLWVTDLCTWPTVKVTFCRISSSLIIRKW